MLSRTIFAAAIRALPLVRPNNVIAAAKFSRPVIQLGKTLSSSILSTTRASFHSTSAAFDKVKTKKAAAKRMIKTGKGDLKYGKAGKRHLNKHKSRTRVSRLGEKGILEGVWAKKMKILLPY